MRKYVIGFVVGAGLTFAIQAGAASLLGTTVDAVIQVEVDGESLGQAPVIDGVSYLPVRTFGNKAGYEVTFGEGKATLESEQIPILPADMNPDLVDSESESKPTMTMPESESSLFEETATIEQLQTAINIAKANIAFTKENIKRAEELGDSKSAEEQKKYLAEREANLADFETRKAALEAQ